MTDEALTREQLPTDYADLATEIAELLAEVPKDSTWEDRAAYVARCLLRKFTITPILALLPSEQGKDGGEPDALEPPSVLDLILSWYGNLRNSAKKALSFDDMHTLTKSIIAAGFVYGASPSKTERTPDRIRREAFEEAAKLIDGKGAFINRDVTSRQIRALAPSAASPAIQED